MMTLGGPWGKKKLDDSVVGMDVSFYCIWEALIMDSHPDSLTVNSL